MGHVVSSFAVHCCASQAVSSRLKSYHIVSYLVTLRTPCRLVYGIWYVISGVFLYFCLPDKVLDPLPFLTLAFVSARPHPRLAKATSELCVLFLFIKCTLLFWRDLILFLLLLPPLTCGSCPIW